MQTRIWVTCVLASMLSMSMAQEPQAKIKPGIPAPAISVEELLQAPDGSRAMLDAFKGKVLVLDFWATWCGPCVAALPHLNDLVSTFQDKPVQFLFLTDEERWRVERFLKIHSIAGWIGFNPSRTTFDRYGVNTLPTTVLIDAAGSIAAVTGTSGVTEKIIEDVLAGRPIPIPAVNADQPKAKDPVTPPLVEMLVRAAKPAGSTRRNDHEIVARGARLIDILSMVYTYSKARIVAPESLADATYDVSFVVPPGRKDSLVELASKTLGAALGLTVSREMQERDVYILRAPDGVAALRPAARDLPIMSDEGQVTSRGTQLKHFANVMEATLNRPILDETGARGLFDLALYWDSKNPDSVLQAIHDQLGLELKLERRTIEVMVAIL